MKLDNFDAGRFWDRTLDHGFWNVEKLLEDSKQVT